MLKDKDFPRGIKGRTPEDERATANHWLTPSLIESEVKLRERLTFKPGSILLGTTGDTLIGRADDRHMLTVAGSRSGKGVSAIIPNLLDYPGSALIIDPKGENATITALRRGRGGTDIKAIKDAVQPEAIVLDPYESVRGPAASLRGGFNPLDMLDVEDPVFIDDATQLADMIVISNPKSHDPHFDQSARELIKGLILYVCATREGRARTLIEVNSLLRGSEQNLQSALIAMTKMTALEVGGAISAIAHSFAEKPERERGSVLSTARRHTEFLDSPAMRDVLSVSSFNWKDLKDKSISVYLCLPAGRFATHSRWLRLMIGQALEWMERYAKKPKYPVLFCMDEFPVLGHMQALALAAGQVAGFGVKLWPIIQDITQLKAHYSDNWETFIGNTGVTQWFGNVDQSTLDYLSKMLGRITIPNISLRKTTFDQNMRGQDGKSISWQSVPLMEPHEIAQSFSRQSGAQIIAYAGLQPIALERLEYWRHPFFAGKFCKRPEEYA